jgi:excisionase family DNA binding protein
MNQPRKATAICRPPVRKRTASEQLKTVRSVAELLLVSDRTVRRWINDKKLKAHSIGGAIRLGSADLIVFIQHARKGGAPLRTRNPLEDTFYTVESVAEILNVCVRTVRRRNDSGVLVAHDFFGIIRVADSDLRDFIDRSVRD